MDYLLDYSFINLDWVSITIIIIGIILATVEMSNIMAIINS